MALSAALACAGPLGFDATSADGASTAWYTLMCFHCGDERVYRMCVRTQPCVCERMRVLQCQNVVVLNIYGCFKLLGPFGAGEP